jgi:hypothetical protein
MVTAHRAGDAFNLLVNDYETTDGRWIALCMLQPDLYWEPFCGTGRCRVRQDDRRASHGDRSDGA